MRDPKNHVKSVNIVFTRTARYEVATAEANQYSGQGARSRTMVHNQALNAVRTYESFTFWVDPHKPKAKDVLVGKLQELGFRTITSVEIEGVECNYLASKTSLAA